jgi:hypothetical protein
MQGSIISGLTHFLFLITLEPLRKSNQDRGRCAIPFLFEEWPFFEMWLNRSRVKGIELTGYE